MRGVKHFFNFLLVFSFFASLMTVAFSQERGFQFRPSFWWSPRLMLVGVGNSLTQGTRDAVNNEFNTRNAYLQRVFLKLKQTRLRFKFVQPFLNENEQRINPWAVPTNLAVDGEDIFSVEGYEYGPRVGSAVNYIDDKYLCDRLQPYLFADMQDKVLYPINLLAGQPVSQFEALLWRLNHHSGPAWVIWWVGTNDAALAALGLGGKNPFYLPIPFAWIKDKLKPGVAFLLEYGYANGLLSFSPFTKEAINRNLTQLEDFKRQYNHLLNRLRRELRNEKVDFFILTFPYYTEPGYFMGKEELCYYFGNDFSLGKGRISLLTFICLYALVKSDESYRLPIILRDDTLIMSREERRIIRSHLDDFNDFLKFHSWPSFVYLVDIGSRLNKLFDQGLWVKGQHITRKWSRGGAFCLDGVHPSHTVHAHIANLILQELNRTVMRRWGRRASLWSLESILENDPYFDHDGDGWVAGPDYKASGRTKILFLFKDADGDTGSGSEAGIDTMEPDEIWSLISDALLEEIITIPLLRIKAEEMGLIPVEK